MELLGAWNLGIVTAVRPSAPVDKVSVIVADPGTNPGRRRYWGVFKSGGSPLTPRIAVWRKDLGLRPGVFFFNINRLWGISRAGRRTGRPYPVVVGLLHPI
jgi:hypothetical protein